MPNGPSPAAANASTAPSENTSLAVLVFPPRACSGARNPGDPITPPVRVSAAASAACAMPKSIRRGPSGASITLDGLRSRCTIPARCTATSASARLAPSANTDAAGSGPSPATASASDSPGR